VIPPSKCSGGHAFPIRISGCALEYTLARSLNRSLSGEGLSTQQICPALVKTQKPNCIIYFQSAVHHTSNRNITTDNTLQQTQNASVFQLRTSHKDTEGKKRYSSIL
jgi:hypothetical protein